MSLQNPPMQRARPWRWFAAVAAIATASAIYLTVYPAGGFEARDTELSERSCGMPGDPTGRPVCCGAARAARPR